MTNQKKQKMAAHEKRHRKNLLIVGILAAGLILTTLLGIINAALS